MSEANRVRAASLCAVAVFLGITGALCPDPVQRGTAQYLFVITLGYGHLIGALVFSRERLARLVPAGVPPRLFGAFAATCVANAFVAYAVLVTAHPSAFVPLLAISIWHVAENDRALARAVRPGLRLAPAGPSALEPRVVAVTAALIVAAAALLGPAAGPLDVAPVAWLRRSAGLDWSGVRWFGFADLFTAVTLYHLTQFLVHSGGRAAALRAAGLPAAPLLRRMLCVHLAPALLCVAALAVPDPRAVALRDLVFSPGIYLFWSVLHVAQTLAVRIEPTAPPLAVRNA